MSQFYTHKAWRQLWIPCSKWRLQHPVICTRRHQPVLWNEHCFGAEIWGHHPAILLLALWQRKDAKFLTAEFPDPKRSRSMGMMDSKPREAQFKFLLTSPPNDETKVKGTWKDQRWMHEKAAQVVDFPRTPWAATNQNPLVEKWKTVIMHIK